ncbi:MAG TPA: tetratricopeptide repeat protein, partial [Puia sp.]
MKIFYLLLFLIIVVGVSAQQARPSKEQMEADRKKLAEAMKQLEEQRAAMSPAARKSYDSALNSVGMGARMDNAISEVSKDKPGGPAKVASLVPAKDAKKIASIGKTPSASGMGAYVASVGAKMSALVVPAAKGKGEEVYKGLKSKGATSAQIGNAATMLWVQGRTQIAVSLMAQACGADPANTDNLNNYASMLTMTGGAELAIPILERLNAMFKKNSTILNNLGQAWFALGDVDKAEKYLDSTLRISAAHPQANMTRCLIDQSKGNKAAAIAHAKASFKQGYSGDKKDNLQKLGYNPDAGDYNYPVPKPEQTPDLLNLGGWAMPSFPKSVGESRGLAPVWKQFRADIDQRLASLQKASDKAGKEAVNLMQERINKGIALKNSVLANPGSVSQSSLAVFNIPFYGEKVGMKEKIVLDNLVRKKAAVVQKIKDFMLGDGAALRKKYEDTKKGIEKKMKEDEKKSVSQTVDPGVYCPAYAKAASEFLKGYNTVLEGLYFEYLQAEKQYLNEFAWANLYTTWPAEMVSANIGFQMQWLRVLAVRDISFESITTYTCEDEAVGKGGTLSEFRDPNCE